MQPPTNAQRRTIEMFAYAAGKGVVLRVLGEDKQFGHPVIEIIDFMESKSKVRRSRKFRVDIAGRTWWTRPEDIVPIDKEPLPHSDRAWLNEWTVEMI